MKPVGYEVWFGLSFGPSLAHLPGGYLDLRLASAGLTDAHEV
jgi:hypothetical protein